MKIYSLKTHVNKYKYIYIRTPETVIRSGHPQPRESRALATSNLDLKKDRNMKMYKGAAVCRPLTSHVCDKTFFSNLFLFHFLLIAICWTKTLIYWFIFNSFSAETIEAAIIFSRLESSKKDEHFLNIFWIISWRDCTYMEGQRSARTPSSI